MWVIDALSRISARYKRKTGVDLWFYKVLVSNTEVAFDSLKKNVIGFGVLTIVHASQKKWHRTLWWVNNILYLYNIFSFSPVLLPSISMSCKLNFNEKEVRRPYHTCSIPSASQLIGDVYVVYTLRIQHTFLPAGRFLSAKDREVFKK